MVGKRLAVDILSLKYYSYLTWINYKCSVLYLSAKEAEGTSCTYTQPLRGRATLPRWQPGVHFQPVSASVTCASGSTCMALTGWERWRWFNASHISINNSKSFICVSLCQASRFQTCFFFIVICCQTILHSQPEGLIWFCQTFLSHFTVPLNTLHSAYRQSPDTHRRKWKSPCQEIIHQSTTPHKLDYHIHLFMSFLGVFVGWVNFKTTNNKQMLRKQANWVWCSEETPKTTCSRTVEIHKIS